MKKQKAFTLIELVVVMAIVEFLMLVLIGGIIVARNASVDAANRSDASATKLAIEAYYARKGSYPPAGTYSVYDAVGASGILENYGLTQAGLKGSCSKTGTTNTNTFVITGTGPATTYAVKPVSGSSCTATLADLTGP
jgi:type II secretory pathway pseudopilin PulG